MRCTAHVARIDGREMCGVSLGERKGEGTFGRHGRGWEDNVTIGHQQTVWVDVDWIALAQARDKWLDVVKLLMNPCVP